jgi:phenylacetate-coenzyme A ligase PaaK-like adenylate-forming protein
LIPTVKNIDFEQKIFEVNEATFNNLCIDIFNFQYQNNAVYQKYCTALGILPNTVIHIEQIPFLPIQFFKTHTIKTTAFKEEAIFESSGTTQTVNSKHFVKDVSLYKKSFTKTFEQFYGNAKNWCVIGLLPSYLERNNSSLVMMVDDLIKQSNNILSGFYLYDIEKLHATILHNEIAKQPTLLIGVTYALLDFAKQYKMQLKYTTIIETGGMKGRREEMTRKEVHEILQNKFGVSSIHSEYGMTELLSQAYSKKDGVFFSPNWMKILIREEDDPFSITANSLTTTTGLINVIDLANLYSCSFIATDDVGKLYANGGFEVLGRKDNSDLRGCSLLTI